MCDIRLKDALSEHLHLAASVQCETRVIAGSTSVTLTLEFSKPFAHFASGTRISTSADAQTQEDALDLALTKIMIYGNTGLCAPDAGCAMCAKIRMCAYISKKPLIEPALPRISSLELMRQHCPVVNHTWVL